MMESLHLITVHEKSESDVVASGARLSVRVEGQSFFTGAEAFKKAAEVSNLVSALKELGLSEDQIDLTNVATDVESGLLLKTSSATYHLVVTCDSTGMLGRVLSAIASQKNATMESIAWQYPGIEKTARELLQDAVRASKETASLIAGTLNAPLVGIHALSYETSGLDTDFDMAGGASFGTKRRAKMKTSALDSLDLSHTTTVTVKVKAEFIVDRFAQPGT